METSLKRELNELPDNGKEDDGRMGKVKTELRDECFQDEVEIRLVLARQTLNAA